MWSHLTKDAANWQSWDLNAILSGSEAQIQNLSHYIFQLLFKNSH